MTFAQHSMTGAIGGLQAGYNYQVGNFVLGGEFSVDLAGIDGQASCLGNYGDITAQCANKIDGVLDLTARLGFTPLDRLLVYVRGGAAYAWGSAQPKNEVYMPDPTYYWLPGYNCSNLDRWGYVIGAGTEYAITDHWTLGFDYKYSDFGAQT